MTWGFFLLRDLVQPRPDLHLLRAAHALAARRPGGGAGRGGGAGGGLRRPGGVRVALPARRDRAGWRPVERALPPLAAGLLVCCNLLEFRQRLRLSRPRRSTRVTFYAGFAVDRARPVDPAAPPPPAGAAGRSAHALGDRRLRHRPARFHHRRAAQSAGLFDDLLGRGRPATGPRRPALPAQRRARLVRLRGDPPAARDQRRVPAAARHRDGRADPGHRGADLPAHEWLGHHKDVVPLPESAWLVVLGPLLMLGACTSLHEHAVHLADHAFSRRYHRAQRCLEQTSLALRAARSPGEVDRAAGGGADARRSISPRAPCSAGRPATSAGRAAARAGTARRWRS